MAARNASHTTHAAADGRVSVSWPDLRRRLRARDLLETVEVGPEAPAPDAVDLDWVTDDSRTVRPGGGFVAVRGTETDGHSFIGDAVDEGARVVVCEAIPDDARRRYPDTIFAQVTESRKALAEMAAALYGDPADALRLVGVTGTNGKTTVAFLVHHLLDALGETAGLLSTIEVRAGDDITEAALTTPGPLTLQKTLRRMVDRGCTACGMEVSSHALDQDRVYGLDFDVAVFTNLTVDHLDYHGSPDAYRRAKKRLFDGLDPSATALYNADDAAGPTMVADTDATVRSFALEQAADIEVTLLEDAVDGLRLAIDGYERRFALAGRFNAYNLAAAYGVGRACDAAPTAVLDALAEAPPVPGRLERIDRTDGPTVIVDYAHTPDALETVLRTVRAFAPDTATVWCVFGCGGDRDPTKRSTMGGIAEELADRVIVTSDNPRTEDPEAIMADIRTGVSRPAEMEWIVDREAAIRTAAERADPDDIVLIAGKGHETQQTIGTDTRPFDDREMARRYFG